MGRGTTSNDATKGNAMKVLYIGHYKDGTGWGNAAINNILALDAVGVKVVPRAITFETEAKSYPDRIKDLEQAPIEECDVCIQHTLPHLYSYDSNFTNIGFIASETNHFKDSCWQHYANLMDAIWVPTSHTKGACRMSGITVPVHVAPHSLNVSSYGKMTEGNKIQELEHTFNFVFIGEFIERKNIQALIRAFHTEFDLAEPVNLYIKTSQQPLEYIQNYCQQIKNGLKIRKRYKEEIIVCGHLNKEDYVSVLSQCHSFVMPSRGEAFCIPALEAMALGIPVIHTKNTGMDDFCIGSAVESMEVPCVGAVSTLANLCTANNRWSEIDVAELAIAMRNAYMKWNTESAQAQRKEAIKKAKLYSHQKIGKQLKELLHDS